MRRRSGPIALALALALGGAGIPEARAQQPPPEGPRPAAQSDLARKLFGAGAQAYAKGDYVTALAAFDEAYRADPRPGILFSMAQAHRRQFVASSDAEHLKKAIEHYRAYLDKVPEGGRRADATQALIELEPAAAKLAADDAQKAPPAAAVREARTRLIVASVDGANVALDAGQERPAPLVQEVAPGKHRVRVSAEGHLVEDKEVRAIEGLTVLVEVPLREVPAQLGFPGGDGADLVLDDRPAGRLPLALPLDVTPGRHFVAVTRRGHRPFAQEVELVRGEKRQLPVKLEPTGQRVASYAIAGLAVSAAVAGGVFAAVSYAEERRAVSILDASEQANVPQSDLDDYHDAQRSRDGWRTASIAMFGGAIAGGVVAAALFVFDEPGAPASPRGADKPPAPTPIPTPLDISFKPLAAPGLVGGAARARF